MKKILILTALIFLSGFNSVFANPEKIDMTKWQYNSVENVFYQLGILYCDNPVDTKYEKLAVFVPAQYMQCNSNGDDTYSCIIDKTAKIKNYTAKTAPIVMPIETPKYMSNPALTEYKSVWDYTNEGFIYIYTGCRGIEHGAPAGVTDLKASIKYIKYNKNIIPGNVDRIFTFGMSGGGAQSVLLGATGDSKLYKPYLKQIGALEKYSDSIYGSMSWCPITNLDTANIAYEWSMGSYREGMDEKTKKLSDSMAKEYVEYVNNAKFRDENRHLLTLRDTSIGIYQGGNYYSYLEKLVNQSLTNFLVDNLFPVDMDIYGKEEGFAKLDKETELSDNIKSEQEDILSKEIEDNVVSLESDVKQEEKPKTTKQKEIHGVYQTGEDYINALNSNKKWISYNNYKVQILSMDDFIKNMKPAEKPVGAFDGLEKQQNENMLFGYGDGKGSHFDEKTAKILENTEYLKEFQKDFAKVDFVGNNVQIRVNMYNPLYFLMPVYKGYKTAKVAKYWRIRTGLSQTDTALTTEANLALALKQYVNPKNVDFETVWGCKHVKAERRGTSVENFVNWVNRCLNTSKL